ncbi:HTH domain-containing protein, partial [Candidatus Woesearchaeota archaeon]|nr:HTH domain-containing protein [Candidatus Woesearchaeota archaeon]
IIKVISSNPEFTRNQIAEKLKVSSETIKEYLAKLKNKGKLKRIGGRKTGQWEIIK